MWSITRSTCWILWATLSSWNPGAERIKGYSADEIIGQHFSRFYTAEDRAAGVPRAGAEDGGDDGPIHGRGLARAQGWQPVLGQRRHRPGLRTNGELVGFAKITRDMTEQRAAQIATLESERRFRLLVQGVTDYAIYMLDPDGDVTNWNAGAQRIKGYRRERDRRPALLAISTPRRSRRGLPGRRWRQPASEGRYEAEGWRVRKDGSRFWASVGDRCDP